MRLKQYLNEAKPKSIHWVKKQFKSTAEEFMKLVSKVYKISNVYDIEITSKLNYSGLCDHDERTIYIKTSSLDWDTLYHEMAHWVQREGYGVKSFCGDMSKYKDFDSEVANKHTRLQRGLQRMAKDMGYHEKFREIMMS